MAKSKSPAKRKRDRPSAQNRSRSGVSRRPGNIRMIRVARSSEVRLLRSLESGTAAPDPGVPVAMIAAGGGPVTVGISFGQAQHGQYTIQLFDPAGTTEILRQPGLNTDAIPDQFTMQATPAQLNQHILQWSGAISAFTPAPGQQFSVTFDVTQNGLGVPGGKVQRAGALAVTQAFVGVLRLVTL